MMRPRPAFTLLEVVLAIGLTAVIAGSISTLLWTLGDRRESLLRTMRDQRTGDILVQRLEDDVLAAIAAGPNGAAGIAGNETSLTLLTRGVWIAPPGSTNDEAASPEDLQSTSYSFDPGSGIVSVSRARSGPAASPEPLGDHIARVRFRYFDGSAWVETFDSARSGALPAAIEVAVWFGKPPAAATGDSPSVETEVLDESAAGGAEIVWPVPDRLRTVIIPDGPTASWSQP